MLVLNATTRLMSFMNEKNDLIQVRPGQVSEVIIASAILIRNVIKSGTPSELGIIVQGSWEFDVARSISAAHDYLYTDLMEAKSKLIDPSIDYSGNLIAARINNSNAIELTKKNEEIKALKTEIQNLKSQISTGSSESQVVRDNLDKKLAKLGDEFQKVQTERDRLQVQLNESQDSVKDLTEKLNISRNQLGTAQSELKSSSDMIDKLSNEIEAMKSESLMNESADEEIAKLRSELAVLEQSKAEFDFQIESKDKEIKDWDALCQRKDAEIKDLKLSLKEASSQIESMKVEFNKACEIANLQRDDDGNWYIAE